MFGKRCRITRAAVRLGPAAGHPEAPASTSRKTERNGCPPEHRLYEKRDGFQSLTCRTVSRRPAETQLPCLATEQASSEPRRCQENFQPAVTPLVAAGRKPRRVRLAHSSFLTASGPWPSHAEGSIRLPACRTPSVAAQRRAARIVVIDQQEFGPARKLSRISDCGGFPDCDNRQAGCRPRPRAQGKPGREAGMHRPIPPQSNLAPPRSIMRNLCGAAHT